MSHRDPRTHATGDRTPSDADTFERWLVEGLAPDAADDAAGRRLAEAWRDRRRALDGGTLPRAASLARHLRAWWWAPTTVAAIVLVAVVAWPSPPAVDGSTLAHAYLEAMGTLPVGAP